MNRRYSILRRVRTDEAKAIRRLTGTNPFQAKRLEVAPYQYAPHRHLLAMYRQPDISAV